MKIMLAEAVMKLICISLGQCGRSTKSCASSNALHCNPSVNVSRCRSWSWAQSGHGSPKTHTHTLAPKNRNWVFGLKILNLIKRSFVALHWNSTFDGTIHMPKCELGFFLVILLLCLASHRKGLRAQAAVRKLFRASGFGIKKIVRKI